MPQMVSLPIKYFNLLFQHNKHLRQTLATHDEYILYRVVTYIRTTSAHRYSQLSIFPDIIIGFGTMICRFIIRFNFIILLILSQFFFKFDYISFSIFEWAVYCNINYLKIRIQNLEISVFIIILLLQ